MEYLEIRQSTIIGAGNGVFATKDLRAKLSMGSYGGEVLTYNQLVAKYPDKLPEYVMYINRNRYIDGSVGGNILSMINSPRGTAKKANVRFTRKGTVVTKSKIKNGSELFVAYGTNYWNSKNIKGH